MTRRYSYSVVGLLIGALLITAILAEHLHRQGAEVLKMAHGLEEAHPVHQALLYMKAQLEARTGGTLRLDIYPNAVMGGETETLEQVQAGQLAMTKVSTAALEAQLPEIRVFGLPFLFRDEAHYWKVLQGPIGEQMLEAGRVKERGFFGLCYYDAGARSFYTTRKPIRSIADVVGMKVRVMNSPSALDIILAMEGSPCPIVWGELYTALAQGTVDAAENNPPSFVTSRHYEVCKYFVLDEHQRLPDMLVFSTKVWETLSPEHQALFREVAVASQVYQRQLWQADTQKAIAFLKEQGISITVPEMEGFQAVAKRLATSAEYADVKPLYDAIQEVQ